MRRGNYQISSKPSWKLPEQYIYGQESIVKLHWHMMHMYIYDKNIPKMS